MLDYFLALHACHNNNYCDMTMSNQDLSIECAYMNALLFLNIARYNKILWLCLVPTSTTWFASDLVYRMAKKIVGLHQEILFMNNDIKFLDIEWRTPYPLTDLKTVFGLRASVIFSDSNMCGILFICTLASSQTLVVIWHKSFILFH